MVLISLSTGPLSVTKKSTRASDLQSSAWKHVTAMSCSWAISSSEYGAGMVAVTPSSRYFVSKP